MSQDKMRGVYPILLTPFDEQYRVDVESLQSLVSFLVNAGVHGVGVAMGSEVLRLSEQERALVTRTVVDEANGRVPVVINSTGAGTDLALLYSRMAEENGADALMIVAPSFVSIGGAEIRESYRAVSDAVGIPIFIQDTSSMHVSADLARQIAEESEQVQYIKVESMPSAVMVAEAVEKAGHALTVFGGAGGNYFIEEMRRGSEGTMPFCSQPAEFVEVWDRFHASDEQGARDVFYSRILPVNRLSGLGRAAAYYHIHKELLRQRGVLRTAVVRKPIAPLEDRVRRELQAVIDELYPS